MVRQLLLKWQTVKDYKIKGIFYLADNKKLTVEHGKVVKLASLYSTLNDASFSIVCTPLSGGRRWASYQIFEKGGIERSLVFRGGLVRKRGVTFLRGAGGCDFYVKNKLKSEIFNEKKVDKEKYFSLS